MMRPIRIETDFGNFVLQKTDLSRGSSCSQCACRDYEICHLSSLCCDYADAGFQVHFTREVDTANVYSAKTPRAARGTNHDERD